MGASVDRLDKPAALQLAAQAHRAPSSQDWGYADAVLVLDV
jgi:hypothetical protein